MSYQNGPPKIVTDGLVLMLDPIISKSYPGSGNTIYDLSGRGNNGTINGATYWSDGRGSFYFDGNDSYIINSSTQNLPIGSSSRTVELWVYLINNTNNFIQMGGSPGQKYIIQYYNISGINYLFTDGVNGNNNISITESMFPVLNSWNHIIFGNSGQNYFYYLNNSLKKSGTWPTSINTNGQKYIIGKRDDSASNTFNGKVSSVKIYNRALSANEVSQNYNSTKYRFGL
jgi:hypothetical protein